MRQRIVELKTRPRERVTVTLSGGRFFTVPAERAASLSVGLELGADDVGQLDRIDQYFRGRDKAVRALSLRARTRREVRSMLDGMEIDAPIRDGIIAELEELGLVDDERLAREFVRVRSEVRSMGPHRLRHDLEKRGVRSDVVEEVLGDEIDASSQEALARALVERKTRGAVVDERLVRRVAGMLRRKGYDYEIVNRICYELLQHVGSTDSD